MKPYLDNLRQTPSVWIAYVLLYIPAGFVMNSVGQVTEIAMFANWWQVLTCYGLYLIPASLLWRHRSWFDQYLWGLLVLGVLEILGYALGTSIAFTGNILDSILGERSFALAMTLFFAGIIPLGNFGAARIASALRSTTEVEADRVRVSLRQE